MKKSKKSEPKDAHHEKDVRINLPPFVVAQKLMTGGAKRKAGKSKRRHSCI